MNIDDYRKMDRETNRQKGRQTLRFTYIQADRLAQRQTERHTD